MILRPILLFIVIFFGIYHLAAQGLPKIIPPSPDASSLGKYADIPVSKYSGMPSISVPLYEIKVRDISLPISLSYHASGNRVEEEASWVGLGWTLNAGGVITRMTRGTDDFLNEPNYHGYLSSSFKPTQDPEWENLFKLCKKTDDGEPDIFYFNFAGMSGKFYLEQKVNPSDPLEPVRVRMLSPEKMKISYNEPTGTWTVWDKSGYKYTFGTKEYTQTWSGKPANSRENASFNLVPGIEANQQKVISAWYLDSIESPLGEMINFEYSSFHPISGDKLVSRSIVNVSEESSDCVGTGFLATLNAGMCPEFQKGVNSGFGGKFGFVSMLSGYNQSNTPFDFSCLYENSSGFTNDVSACSYSRVFFGSMQVVENIYLKKILFNGGTVSFNTSDRADIQEGNDPFVSTPFAKPQKLDEVIVAAGQKTLKKITFTHQYWDSQSPQNSNPYLNKRLRLDAVIESNGSLTKPAHRFLYNEAIKPPLKNSFSRDHWGFFNDAQNDNAGRAGQPSLIPKFKFFAKGGELISWTGADREANEAKSMWGVLSKIIYPTGGYTQFQFESNTFNINQVTSSLPTINYTPSVNSEDPAKRFIAFELKEATEVAFNAEFKCKGTACYPSGYPPECTIDKPLTDCFGAIRSKDSDYYLTVTRLSDGVVVWSGKNYDFYCVQGSGSDCQRDPYFSDVSVTCCGIQKSKKIGLSAGRYLMKAIAPAGLTVKARADFVQSQQITSYSVNSVVKGGGLRVKSVVHVDGLSPKKDQYIGYNYHFKEANQGIRSAGKLMTFPKYSFGVYFLQAQLDGGFSLTTKIISRSNSNLPLGSSAQGALVGYDKVEEIIGNNGVNGKTVGYFKNQPDDEPYPFFPNSPTINHSPSNGLLEKQEVFDANGFMLKEITNNYDSRIEANALGGIILINENTCNPETDTPLDWATPRERGDFVFKYYSEPSEWWYQTQSTERTFDASDPTNGKFLTRTSNSYYDNADHKQITRTTSTTSEGKTLSTRIYYPLDLPDRSPREMWDETQPNYKHAHSNIVKQESFVKDVRTAGLINNYAFDSDSKQVRLATIEQALQNGNYENRVVFEKYDQQGNVLQVRKSNDTPITYLWGYGNKFPIAQIKNATYDQVSAQISPADMELLRGNTLSPQQIRDKLDILRTSLRQAQVTILTYDPFVGQVSVTDSNNKSTYYEYDDLQRLFLIKDFELDRLTEFRYNYKR